MGKYFGTDGFRGEAGIDLTADHAYKVGRFLGWYYNALRERNGNNEPARIVIGMRYGSLFDATQTMVAKIDDDTYQVQVVSWYDNENSYTSQMVRTIKYFAEL